MPKRENDKDKDKDSLSVKQPRLTAAPAIIACSFPPDCSSRPFASLQDFESHYLQTHTNRCLECGRNFPSEWFLDLHIRENHDMLSQLKSERGDKIFGCFVAGCGEVYATPQARRVHLVDEHLFPEDYDWGIVDCGIDTSTSLLRTDKSISHTTGAMEISNPTGR